MNRGARLNHRVAFRIVDWFRGDYTFCYDYNQLYLHDDAHTWSEGFSEYLDALEDLRRRDLSVGLANGLVDLLMPRQDNFNARLTVIGTRTMPGLELDGWDHVVTFPLTVTSGRVTLSASGGSGDVTISVPPGRYCARWSGRAFDLARDFVWDDHTDPPDNYRLELWPDESMQPPAELKRWSGGRMRHEP